VAFASNFGRTTYWGVDYYMPAWAYDGASEYTQCEDVFVMVLRWIDENGNTAVLGWEWYKHVESTLGGGQWYNI